MGNVSKARAEGLVWKVGVDLERAALERIEAVATFLGITRTEMARRILHQAAELPIDHEIWQGTAMPRKRKIYRDDRRVKPLPPTATA